MPSFFKAGKQAFTTGASTYTGAKTATKTSEYLDSARGFATEMAKSKTNSSSAEKKTVSQDEFLAGMKFDGLSQGKELVDLIFNKKETVSIDRAAQIIRSLDTLDTDGLNGKIDDDFKTSLNSAYKPGTHQSLNDIRTAIAEADASGADPTDTPAETPKKKNHLFGQKNSLLKLLGLGLGIGLLVKFIKKQKGKRQSYQQPLNSGAQIISFGSGSSSGSSFGLPNAGNVIQL